LGRERRRESSCDEWAFALRANRSPPPHSILPPEPRPERPDFSRAKNSRVEGPHRSAEGRSAGAAGTTDFAFLRAATTSQENRPESTTLPLHFQPTNGKVTKRQEQPDEYQIARHDA